MLHICYDRIRIDEPKSHSFNFCSHFARHTQHKSCCHISQAKWCWNITSKINICMTLVALYKRCYSVIVQSHNGKKREMYLFSKLMSWKVQLQCRGSSFIHIKLLPLFLWNFWLKKKIKSISFFYWIEILWHLMECIFSILNDSHGIFIIRIIKVTGGWH